MYKLIVDFEATCSKYLSEFPREDMEIIEVGSVLLNHNNEFVSSFSRFIRPVKHPILTDFCKELTTIKQEDVDYADLFEKVIPDFQKWVDLNVDGEYTFYSWGNFDKNILNRQCKELGVKGIKMIYRHVNAKAEFAKANNLDRECGVWKALKLKNMRFQGVQHRAYDDALNITELVKTLG